MNKQIIKITAILLCLTALASIGSAKSASRTFFEIGFDFVYQEKSFPAGKYSIERLSPASPNLVVLKQVGGRARAVLMARTNADVSPKAQLKLSFSHSGDSYYLVGIAIFGERYSLAPASRQSPPASNATGAKRDSVRLPAKFAGV